MVTPARLCREEGSCGIRLPTLTLPKVLGKTTERQCFHFYTDHTTGVLLLGDCLSSRPPPRAQTSVCRRGWHGRVDVSLRALPLLGPRICQRLRENKAAPPPVPPGSFLCHLQVSSATLTSGQACCRLS